MGPGNARHPVAQFLDDMLDVHRDQRLVLDDQDVGRDLAGNAFHGLLHKIIDPVRGNGEDFRGFRMGKAFDRRQEKSLAGRRRQYGEVGARPLFPGIGRLALGNIDLCGTVEGCKQFIDGDTVAAGLRKAADIRNQRLERGCDIGITGLLRSGNRPGVPTQKRQMWRNAGRK